jgi:FKBP-type peptidyl-prolyl cis-trans isomerase 2
VTVVNADENTVTLDANHPLAGKDLNFDIELVAIN